MRTFRTAVPILVLLALAGPVAAQEKPRLPEGVVALVRGKTVTTDQFRAALVHRFSGTPEGSQVLETLVADLAVEAERARRGITVSTAEIDTYIEKVAKQVFDRSAGLKTLDDWLEEQGITKVDLRKETRAFLIRQKMAAADLGDPDGEVSQAELGVWVEDLKRKAGVVIGSPPLPAGAFARVGGRTIGTAEFGKALLEDLPEERLESALWDLAISTAVKLDLAKAGMPLVPEDVDRAVADLEQEFRDDPRFRNTSITFAQYVKTVRHMSLDELKEDPAFLAQVGLGKMIRSRLTQAQVEEYYQQNSDRYGEQRTFVHLLIRGDDNPTPFGPAARSMADARKKIDRIQAELRAGTPFGELLKKYSEARSEQVKPEDPIQVSRETPMPETMKETVFSAPIGEVVGPVRSSFGYHLVKVLSVTPAPTFEQVRPRVEKDLIRELRSHAILKIRQDPTIMLRY